MKVFYAARVCRPDLLRAITFLACMMTKWSADCDRRLHRLMCYVHATRGQVQVGWIGDDIRDLRMHLYSDADFAGCQSTNRCTSGVFLALDGAKLVVPHSVQLQETASNLLRNCRIGIRGWLLRVTD